MSTILLNPGTKRPFSDRNVRVTGVTLVSGQNALVKTSVVAITVLLPAAPAANAAVAISDADGAAATNNITIDGNGKNIDDAATLVVSANNAIVVLLYDRGQWRAIAQQRVIEEDAALAPVQLLGALSTLGGGVTSVTGTPPITSTGGATPDIGIDPATPSDPGSMSAADKTILDALAALTIVTDVTGSPPIASSGGATPDISIDAATTSDPGSMSAADKAKLDGIQVQGAAVAIPAFDIDWAAGGVFTKTLSGGADTFTFSNAASGMAIVVRVLGAGGTLAWPAVRWVGGVEPTQTASGNDVWTFVHDGTDIYGSVVQDLF